MLLYMLLIYVNNVINILMFFGHLFISVVKEYRDDMQLAMFSFLVVIRNIQFLVVKCMFIIIYV